MRALKNNYLNSALVTGTLIILFSAFMSYFFPEGGLFSPQLHVLANKKKQHAQLKNDSGELTAVDVGWKLLYTLDYEKLDIPSELQGVLNRQVRIPGFAVPLSDGLSNIKEFLLVPNQMACIHVPAPPPNLIVLVELEKGVSMKELSGPLWIEGVLEVKKTNSVYGAAAYEMKANNVTPYSAPS